MVQGEKSIQSAQARKQRQFHHHIKTSSKNTKLTFSRAVQSFDNTTQNPSLSMAAAKALTPERKMQVEAEEAAQKEMENQQTTTAVDDETPPIEPIVEDEAVEAPILPLKQVAKAIRKFKLKIDRNRAIPLTLKRKLEIEAEEAARKAMEIEEEITTVLEQSTTTALPAIWPKTTTLPEIVPTTTTSTTQKLKAMTEFFPPPPTGPSCTSARPPLKCMNVPHMACVANKKLASPASHPNLIARWNFDDNIGADTSGNGHHLLITPQVGPGRFSQGQSARFTGDDFTAIGHSPAWNVHDFAISFWVFLLADDHGGWRTILRKGFPDEGDALTLSLWPKDSLGFTRRLHLHISRQSETVVSLDSQGSLPLQRWTHIAFSIEGKDIQLFLNGIPDIEGISPRKFRIFTGPLYIGGDAWRRGIRGFIDDFQYFGAAVSTKTLRALSAGALGNIGSVFVRFGCQKCPLEEAVQACSQHEGYHLCMEDELIAGAWRVARAQGWLFRKTRLWSFEATKATSVGMEAQQLRLGICCSDENI